MNLIRWIISVFVGAIVVVTVAGWNWAGHQPSPRMEGARVALVLCGLLSVGALWVLWREKPAST